MSIIKSKKRFKIVYIIVLLIIIITSSYFSIIIPNEYSIIDSSFEKEIHNDLDSSKAEEKFGIVNNLDYIKYNNNNELQIRELKNFTKEITKYIEEYAEKSFTPGVCLIGFQSNIPIITLNHNFSVISNIPIASLTKTFTAVLTLMLEEEGYLNIYDPISKYFTVYQKYEYSFGQIKIVDLLRHHSGISYNSLFENTDGYLLPKPSFKVGTYHYSNNNYILLSQLLEKVTQKKFSNLLLEYIIVPLKLKRTELAPYLSGSSGISSNSYDLYQFGQFLLNDYYTRKEKSYLHRMSQIPPKLVKQSNDQNLEFYGLGLMVSYVNNKILYVRHGGLWDGTSVMLIISPEYKLIFVLTSNPISYKYVEVNNFRNNIIESIINFIKKQKNSI